MSEPNHHDDPAVTGVPDETKPEVRPSAIGLVAGPIDGQTDVTVAEVATGTEHEADRPES